MVQVQYGREMTQRFASKVEEKRAIGASRKRKTLPENQA